MTHRIAFEYDSLFGTMFNADFIDATEEDHDKAKNLYDDLRSGEYKLPSGKFAMFESDGLVEVASNPFKDWDDVGVVSLTVEDIEDISRKQKLLKDYSKTRDHSVHDNRTIKAMSRELDKNKEEDK